MSPCDHLLCIDYCSINLVEYLFQYNVERTLALTPVADINNLYSYKICLQLSKRVQVGGGGSSSELCRGIMCALNECELGRWIMADWW